MVHVIEMTPLKLKWIMVCLALACSFIFGAIVLGAFARDSTSSSMNPGTGSKLPPIQGSLSQLVLNAEFPKAPATVPAYIVKSVDTIQEGNEKLSMGIKKSIPTADEAPALAEKALETYGGLPKDASLINAIPLYRSKYNLTTQTVEEKYPVRTQVRYIQKINGSPIYKTGINLMLGENGEILDINKHWITSYDYSGETPVISAEQGYEKLLNGKTTTALQGGVPEGTKISNIELGYYFDEKNGKMLKPVWIYTAIMGPDMEPFNLYVDAEQ